MLIHNTKISEKGELRNDHFSSDYLAETVYFYRLILQGAQIDCKCIAKNDLMVALFISNHFNRYYRV
jgi:hypothetical protein